MSEQVERSPFLARLHDAVRLRAVHRALNPIGRIGRKVPVGSLGRSGWEYLLTSKRYLFAALVVFVTAFLFSTAWMLKQLENSARDAVDIYASLLVTLASKDGDQLRTEVFNIVTADSLRVADFPLISTYPDGSIEAWNRIAGIPPLLPSDMSEEKRQEILRVLKAKVREMDEENDPITFELREHPETHRQIHYGPPKVVRPWAPAAVMGTAFLFIFLGFLGFRNIKNGEQRYIWMGMAKETAHQLGTPLSSLSGWIELMRTELEEDWRRERFRRFDEALREMESDMGRLNRIVSRFSRIGSLPELKPASVTEVISDTTEYFRHRMPQLGRRIEIREEYEEVPQVPMDRELLEWAFENLLRNAIDAMDKSEGCIEVRVRVRVDRRTMEIEFEDNGRGMGPNERRKAFLPGYTTKKRGWGLGLAFVKRIVEEYHWGEIHIKESIPREGTTIQLLLPIA